MKLYPHSPINIRGQVFDRLWFRKLYLHIQMLLLRSKTVKCNTIFFCYFYIIKMKNDEHTRVFHSVSCCFFGLPGSWTFSALCHNLWFKLPLFFPLYSSLFSVVLIPHLVPPASCKVTRYFKQAGL